MSAGAAMFAEGAVTAAPSGELVDLDAVPADDLDAMISQQAAHIAAAEARLVAMTAAAQRRKVWEVWGMRSLAHWLSWRTGRAAPDAHRLAALADALAERPATAAAFAAGELSLSQAHAIARCPAEVEEELVDHARGLTANQLVRLCRTFRRVAAESADEPTDYVKVFDDPDEGALYFSGRATGMFRERMKLALEEAIRELREERRARGEGSGDQPAHSEDDEPADHADRGDAGETGDAGDPGPCEPRPEPRVINAEALERIFETALNSQGTGGSGADRLQAIFYVEVDDLQEIARAWLHDGTTPSLAERARMLCDASVVVQITQNGVALNEGRKVRYPTTAQRRAVGLRDQGCRFPGCGTTRFTEVHHIIHWAEENGPTDLFNLITLCWHHHQVVHLPGWSMWGDANGEVRFRNPHGRAFGARPPTTRATGPPVEQVNRRLGLTIDGETARPAWGGETMSSYALDMLLSSVLPRAHQPIAA